MCGRFCLDADKAEVAREFSCQKVALNRPRYNVAPSQNVTVVIDTPQAREAVLMQWGLVPHWVKDPASWNRKLINARIEIVNQKNSFKEGFQERPCLIPATGFFEWHKSENSSGKQPYCFHTERKLFALAGIYEVWTDELTEEKLLTCTILTTMATGAIASIHDRMPVIVTPEHYDTWLGDYSQRKEFIANLPDVRLQLYPVSDIVNSPRNDVPKCVVPIA